MLGCMYITAYTRESIWLIDPPFSIHHPNQRSGETEVWQSAVRIQRCRYLEAVQCKGACASICKVPTQSFFTDDLGMPVTMTPDFATLSCTMTFGQRPPTLGEDPVGRCVALCVWGGGELGLGLWIPRTHVGQSPRHRAYLTHVDTQPTQ